MGDETQEMGDRRQETEGRKWETGGGKHEMGDGRQETGGGRQETVDGRQETVEGYSGVISEKFSAYNLAGEFVLSLRTLIANKKYTGRLAVAAKSAKWGSKN